MLRNNTKAYDNKCLFSLNGNPKVSEIYESVTDNYSYNKTNEIH
jgi:hypothetical protein